MNIDFLTENINKNTYLDYLIEKAELFNSAKFFDIERAPYELTQKEYIDLLRFGDVLSHSKEFSLRNIAYKIISLLNEDTRWIDIYKIYSEAILSKLGNFPGLDFIDKQLHLNRPLPFKRRVEKNYKKILQAVPYSDYIFTDAQFTIFQSLKNSNHFSFSGPTSLGKSFIIQSFIKYIANHEETKENIVILVPTRALINQVASELIREFKNNKVYNIITYPKISPIFIKPHSKYIFVFTPERLISYLSDVNNPRIGYLFIDEAHKVLSDTDSRSPLYYHTIIQAERKSIKLFFAAPNISNPDVFLSLFELSTDECKYVNESPVTQNRYFLDLVGKKALLFHQNGKESKLKIDINNQSLYIWLRKLGSNQKNIIYCNTVHDTITHAIKFSSSLESKDDKQINEAIGLIKEHLHKDYFLIQCLKKGVAFHFGKLPQNIRQRIEKLFRSKVLDYVFCTSTLLEGVNLPAKNVFILNNAIGLYKFKDIDFWNLAGRAGRLTKELSGNIICVKAENKKNRWNSEEDLEVIRNSKITKKKPAIDKTHRSIFKNMERSLKKEPYSKKNPTASEIDIWNHYANIVLIHEKIGEESVLKSNFIKNVEGVQKLLNTLNQEIKVPKNILIISSSVKPRLQHKIFNAADLEILPNTIDYKRALYFLKKLSLYYEWRREEIYGRNPLIPPKSENILNYYATLMNQWSNGFPVSQIIINSIRWHAKGNPVWNILSRSQEDFQPGNIVHINSIINQVISSIEDVLRFKLEQYFQNYYLIIKEKFGEENAGSNWAEFLEYGTTNKKMIELQNVGFPRHIAKYLLNNYNQFLAFENDLLVSIDLEKLKETISDRNIDERELKSLLNDGL